MNKKQMLSRFLQIFLVLIGISFLTFILIYMAPGDPVRAMFAASGTMPSEAVMNEIREELGLNDPVLVQYFRWLGNCIKGDFGHSYSTGKPVAQLLSARLWPTLKLSLLSLVLMMIVAVPLGMLSAVHQNKPIDFIVRGASFVGVSMPTSGWGFSSFTSYVLNWAGCRGYRPEAATRR